MGRSANSSAAPRSAEPAAVQPAVPLGQWPDKQLLRIGELADLLGVDTHVVRFWLTEFSAVRPQRSSTNRLMFGRPAAEKMLRIRQLLYDQGMTIAGARRMLAAADKPEVAAPPADSAKLAEASRQIDHLRQEVRGAQARQAAAEAGESAALRRAADAGRQARADAAAKLSQAADLLERLGASIRAAKPAP